MRVYAVLLAGCGRIGFDASINDPPSPADAEPDAFAIAGLVAHYAMETQPLDGVVDSLAAHAGACAQNKCPAVVPGHLGSGYRFDGDDLIQIASDPDFTPALGTTISAWILVDTAPASRACAASKPIGGTTTDSWAICVEPDRSLFYFSCTSSCDSLLSPSGVVALGVFQHVAITFDGTTKRIWLGATELASAPATIAYDDKDVLIGGNIDNGNLSAPFVGVLDEVRIFNRAISPAEIALLANP